MIDELRRVLSERVGGGRSTDPSWTERRLVPLSEETLARLTALAEKISREQRVEPMQLAAMLLESSLRELDAWRPLSGLRACCTMTGADSQ